MAVGFVDDQAYRRIRGNRNRAVFKGKGSTRCDDNPATLRLVGWLLPAARMPHSPVR